MLVLHFKTINTQVLLSVRVPVLLIRLSVICIDVCASVRRQPATSQQSSTQDLPTVLNADAGSMSTDMLPCTPGSTMLTDPASTQSSRSVDSFLQGDSLYGSSSGTGK